MKKQNSLKQKRKALELYYNEGKTQKEVAESMKLSVNTIKSWICLERLKNSNKKVQTLRLIINVIQYIINKKI